jgi:anti-sigma B factor antagonist
LGLGLCLRFAREAGFSRCDAFYRGGGRPKDKQVSELGIKERRVGNVTILDTDALMRVRLRFGGSSVTLANAVAALLTAGQKQILLNLEGVRAISAKALGELVSTHLVVKQDGGEFRLFNLTPTVRQMMLVTNLLAVFGLYESEKDAIESLKQ